MFLTHHRLRKARPETVNALVRAKYDADARAFAAERRARDATERLDALVRAINTAPLSVHVSRQDCALARGVDGLVVKAPHVDHPPLQRALDGALRLLRRTL